MQLNFPNFTKYIFYETHILRYTRQRERTSKVRCRCYITIDLFFQFIGSRKIVFEVLKNRFFSFPVVLDFVEIDR